MTAAKNSVLIVDPSKESREVLRTALERDGIQILEANRADLGLALACDQHPHVVVLDLEIEPTHPDRLVEGFREVPGDSPPSLVVLGTARQAQRGSLEETLQNGQFVRKPYHYGPLIRKIEELLEHHQKPVLRNAA